jgi:membrane-associated phospholipid phosphatase
LQYDAVRSTVPFAFTLKEATGVITFPSFHAFFALVNIWAFRGHRRLFVPMAILNVAMVASTLSTGWHYVTDVLGSFLMAAAAIGLVKVYENKVGVV